MHHKKMLGPLICSLFYFVHMVGESQTSECKGNDDTVVRVLHTFIYKTAIYNMYKDLSLGVKQIL